MGKMRDEAVTITLRLPPQELSPNWRGHWAVKSRTVKYYRGSAFAISTSAMGDAGLYRYGQPEPQWLTATARATFYWPNKRRRDKDNASASLKAAFDGIVDAGLLEDDEGLTHLPVVFEVDKANPRVEITITKEPA